MCYILSLCCFFFFNDTATTEIYTLSLHDALPISTLFASTESGRWVMSTFVFINPLSRKYFLTEFRVVFTKASRSEEHTSELQSRQYLVCRLLLEKKKKKISTVYAT